MGGEFVVQFRLGIVNAAFGDVEGAVVSKGERGGVVAGVESLMEGVGSVPVNIDKAVTVGVDQFGDLITAEGEDAIIGRDFERDGFEKSGGDAGPAGGFGFGRFNAPDVAIESG